MLVVSSNHANLDSVLRYKLANDLCCFIFGDVCFFKADQEAYLAIYGTADDCFTFSFKSFNIFSELIKVKIDSLLLHKLQVTAQDLVNGLVVRDGSHKSCAVNHFKVLRIVFF